MLNQLKRGVSLIIGLVLAFYSSWLITQEKNPFWRARSFRYWGSTLSVCYIFQQNFDLGEFIFP